MKWKYDKLATQLSSLDYCNRKCLMASLIARAFSFLLRNPFEPSIMDQTGMDSDMLYVPPEIIRNILIRLPVKSLLRFRCVCRHWKNLIQNSSFIADHLQQSGHYSPSLLFEFNKSKIPLHLRLHLLDCRLQVREVQRAPLVDSLEGARIVGSCNGLLLVEIYNKSPPSLSLWNPATTAVRHVPIIRTDSFDFDVCMTAFGFSPILNDYKIVRTYAKRHDTVNRVEVFSFSTGSWKRIDIGNLKGIRLNNETVTVNGAIFWAGVKPSAKEEVEDNIEVEEDEDDMEEDEDDVEVIVSFDMAKEMFTLISKPDWNCDVHDKLTVYENKLAMVCNICEDCGETPDLIDLWVLDEGPCASGETWSWTKTYTSSPSSCTLYSMTIWRNGIVCEPYPKEYDERGRDALYMVNLTTNEVKRFVIPCRGPVHSYIHYAESLVSVGYNWIEES